MKQRIPSNYLSPSCRAIASDNTCKIIRVKVSKDNNDLQRIFRQRGHICECAHKKKKIGRIAEHTVSNNKNSKLVGQAPFAMAANKRTASRSAALASAGLLLLVALSSHINMQPRWVTCSSHHSPTTNGMSPTTTSVSPTTTTTTAATATTAPADQATAFSESSTINYHRPSSTNQQQQPQQSTSTPDASTFAPLQGPQNDSRPVVFQYHLSHSRPPSLVQMNIQSLVDKTSGTGSGVHEPGNVAKHQHAFFVKAYQLLRELAMDTKRHQIFRSLHNNNNSAIGSALVDRLQQGLPNGGPKLTASLPLWPATPAHYQQRAATTAADNTDGKHSNTTESSWLQSSPSNTNKNYTSNGADDVDLTSILSSDNGDTNLKQMQLQVPLQLHLKLKPLPLPLPPPVEPGAKQRRSLSSDPHTRNHHGSSGKAGALFWPSTGAAGGPASVGELAGRDYNVLSEKRDAQQQQQHAKAASALHMLRRPGLPSKTIPFTHSDAKLAEPSVGPTAIKIISIGEPVAPTAPTGGRGQHAGTGEFKLAKLNQLAVSGGYHTHQAHNSQHHYQQQQQQLQQQQQQQQQQQRGPQSPTTAATTTTAPPTTMTYDGAVSNGRRPPHWTTPLSGHDGSSGAPAMQQQLASVGQAGEPPAKLLAVTHGGSGNHNDNSNNNDNNSNNNGNNSNGNNAAAAALINRHPLNEASRHNYLQQQQQQFQQFHSATVGVGEPQEPKTRAKPLEQSQQNHNYNNNLNWNYNVQKSSAAQQQQQRADSNSALESFREVVVSQRQPATTTTTTTTAQHNKNKPEFKIENANKPLESRLPQPVANINNRQHQPPPPTAQSGRIQVPLAEFWLGDQQASSLVKNQYQLEPLVSQERMVKFWPVEASASPSSAGSVSFLQSYYNQVLRKAPIDSQPAVKPTQQSSGYPMIVKEYDMMTTTDGSKRHIVSASHPTTAQQPIKSASADTTTAAQHSNSQQSWRDGQKLASESAPRSVIAAQDDPAGAGLDLTAAPSTTTTTTVLPPLEPVAAERQLRPTTTTPAALPLAEAGAPKKHRKHKKAVQQQKQPSGPAQTASNFPSEPAGQYPVSIGITNAPSTSVKRVTTLHNGTNVLITVTSSSSVVSSSSSFNNQSHQQQQHHYHPLTTMRPARAALLMANDLTAQSQTSKKSNNKLWSMKEYPTTTASPTTVADDVTTTASHNHHLAEGRLNVESADYGSSLARQVPQPPTPTVASTAAAILMASELKQQQSRNNNNNNSTATTTVEPESETTTVREITVDSESTDDSDLTTTTTDDATPSTTTSTTTTTTTPKPKTSTTVRATKRKRYHNQQQQLHPGGPSSNKSANNKGSTGMSAASVKDHDQAIVATLAGKKRASLKSSGEESGSATSGNIKLFHFKRKPDLKKFPFYNGNAASLNAANATTIDNLPAAATTTTTTIISNNAAKELFSSEDNEPDNESSSLRKYDQVPALKERASSNYVQIKPIATKIAGSSSSSSIVLRGATATQNANNNANASNNNRPYVDHQTTHKSITTKPSRLDTDDNGDNGGAYDDEPATAAAAAAKKQTEPATVVATETDAETNATASAANAEDSNKPIIRLRRKHGDNGPSEQQYNTLGLLNALGQPRQFFKNRHKQHQPPASAADAAPEQVKNHSHGVSLFPSPIMIRVNAESNASGEQHRNEDIVSRKSRARSFTSSSSPDNNDRATMQQQQQQSDRRSDDSATTATERKPLTNLGAINAHGSNAIVLFRHPKKDRRRLESLIQSSNYYRVLISMMKPQQQRELMDLMISKNKSLADAAATYMMNEKNIQLLSAMQLHNKTLMQQQQSNGAYLMTGNNDNGAKLMDEQASQRKASFSEPSTTSAPNMDITANSKPSHMFTSLIGNTPDNSNLYQGAKRSQFSSRDAETRTNQQQQQQQQDQVSTKKVPKLLMKPMRPAKYSLNGYIPKPSLSLLSKDLDSSSTTNEVFSRRKGGINNNQQQTGQNGRPPIASTSARSSSDLSDVKPRSVVLSPQKANLIKARLGLLNTDASERKVSVAPDFSDASSDNFQASSDTGDKSTTLNTIPKTDFECTDKQGKFISGVFADYKTGCQVWHLCSSNRKYSFLCPTGTIFNAKLRICDWQYNIKCQDTRI